MKLNKKGQGGVILIVVIGALLFAGGGIVTFLFSDKTSLILILAFIALILFSKRR